MSQGINGQITAAVLAAGIFTLSACSAIPTAEEYALKKAGIDPNDPEAVQAVAGEVTTKCKRQRSTGSNIGRASCRSVDSGTQPVRESSYREQPPQVPPGLARRLGNN